MAVSNDVILSSRGINVIDKVTGCLNNTDEAVVAPMARFFYRLLAPVVSCNVEVGSGVRSPEKFQLLIECFYNIYVINLYNFPSFHV